MQARAIRMTQLVAPQGSNASKPLRHISPHYPHSPKVKTFQKLESDDFRHPLDRQNTSMLRSLPGLEMVAKTVLGGPGFEQALYLENIGAAIRVGPEQLPTIHNLLLEACTCLDMEPPALYVRQVLPHVAPLSLATPAALLCTGTPHRHMNFSCRAFIATHQTVECTPSRVLRSCSWESQLFWCCAANCAYSRRQRVSAVNMHCACHACRPAPVPVAGDAFSAPLRASCRGSAPLHCNHTSVDRLCRRVQPTTPGTLLAERVPQCVHPGHHKQAAVHHAPHVAARAAGRARAASGDCTRAGAPEVRSWCVAHSGERAGQWHDALPASRVQRCRGGALQVDPCC